MMATQREIEKAQKRFFSEFGGLVSDSRWYHAVNRRTATLRREDPSRSPHSILQQAGNEMLDKRTTQDRSKAIQKIIKSRKVTPAY